MQEWKLQKWHLRHEENIRRHLKNANNCESNTWKSEDNIKITLIKMKASQNENKKCESDTCESENVQKMIVAKN